MANLDFAGNDIHADAFDARGRPREIFVDDRLLEADGFKDLRAAIALDGGDAHLGNHLDDALDSGLHEILAGVLVLDVLEQALADHVVERLELQGIGLMRRSRNR